MSTPSEDSLLKIESRLTAIERRLGMVSEPMPLPEPNSFAETPKPQVRAKPAPSRLDSSSALAMIGIAFVILAGVFFIKITIDSGWMTPMRQVILATATGLVFFIVPHLFPKAAKEYGGYLAGAGTAILHLTWLGAYEYHHLFSAEVTLLCATFVGILSLLVNLGHGNRVYALVAMAGTYLSGPTVGLGSGDIGTLTMYLCIWNLAFSITGFVSRRRDIIFIASYYATFTVLILAAVTTGHDKYPQLLLLQGAQFATFVAMLLGYSIFYKKPMTHGESYAVFPVLMLFYLTSCFLIADIYPDFAPWFGVLTGALVIAIYLTARNFLTVELHSGPALLAFAMICLCHGFYFQLLDLRFHPLGALVLGACAYGVSHRYPDLRKLLFWPLAILYGLFCYGAFITFLGENYFGPTWLYNSAYGIIALLIALAHNPGETLRPHSQGSLLLGFGHLEVLLALYRFSLKITLSGALFVTATWSLYALGILALSYRRRDRTLGSSAIFILLAVGLKAFFYDLSNTTNFIRVGCLLLEGLLLYGCGWIFKRMQAWK